MNSNLPLIDSEGIHGTPVNVAEQYSYGVIDNCTPEPTIGYMQTTPWYVYPTKSAREQVQDEILTKMAEAIEGDDLKKAKELVKLAKALKEL